MSKKSKKKAREKKDLVKAEKKAKPEIFGTDSTSVNEVKILIAEDKGTLLGDASLVASAESFIASSEADDAKTAGEKLQGGEELLGKVYAQYNRSFNAVEGTFANYAIMMGKMLLVMKKLAKEAGVKWEVWASDHVKYMGEANRQNYMRLAERPDAHPYAFLGIDRLLVLISVTKAITTDDKVSEFLAKYHLEYDPEKETNLLGFKHQVDAAIFAEKAEKAGVKVDLEKVINLLEVGLKLDNSLIRDLAMIQDNGGDPNQHLETLHMNQGQGQDFLEPQKRIEGFNKLVVRIKETIDSIIANPELINSIDSAMIQSLEEKLQTLKERMMSN
jgi:hypothetical protein